MSVATELQAASAASSHRGIPVTPPGPVPKGASTAAVLPPLVVDLPVPPPGVSDPLALHRAAIVVDLHADTLSTLLRTGQRFEQASSAAQVTPRHLAEGGVDAQFLALWVAPQTPSPGRVIARQLRLLRDEILSTPGFAIARAAEDVIRIAGEGRHAVLLGLEGTVGLEGNPEAMRALAEAGVRYASVTWNETNPFGTGTDGDPAQGLTRAGFRLVRLMNDLGVVPDVSHASPRTFWDVVTASRTPVVATHSNAAGVFRHRRNLDDVQAFAVAESGGTIGLNLNSRFLKPGRAPATLADVLAHVRHLRAVAGADHLSLGSDFDGGIVPPADLPDAAAWPRLSRALLADGWTPTDLFRVLGTNFLRVLEECRSGERRVRVDHRPAAVARITATASPATVGRARDGLFSTGWRAGPAATVSGRRMVMELAEPGLARVSLWGAGPGAPRTIAKVRVTARCDRTRVEVAAEVELPASIRPVRVRVPGLDSCRAASVSVEVLTLAEGATEAVLNEVVPEVRAPEKEKTRGQTPGFLAAGFLLRRQRDADRQDEDRSPRKRPQASGMP